MKEKVFIKNVTSIFPLTVLQPIKNNFGILLIILLLLLLFTEKIN